MPRVAKKEWNLVFRCSDDRESIEIYNLDTGGVALFRDCGEGTCIDEGPSCALGKETPIQEPKVSMKLLFIAGIVLLLYKTRRR